MFVNRFLALPPHSTVLQQGIQPLMIQQVDLAWQAVLGRNPTPFPWNNGWMNNRLARKAESGRRKPHQGHGIYCSHWKCKAVKAARGECHTPMLRYRMLTFTYSDHHRSSRPVPTCSNLNLYAVTICCSSFEIPLPSMAERAVDVLS